MRVIDSTLFSEDFVALDIRIHELAPVVDLFLICESNFSFSGRPKRLFLSENLSRYEDYLPRIRVLRFEPKLPHANPWVQESLQRQFLTRAIKSLQLSKNDLVISSDCDEIPKLSVIESMKGKSVNHLLELRNYTNYINVESGVYRRGRVASGDNFFSVEKMRQDCYIFDNWTSRRLSFPVMRVPKAFTCRRMEIPIPELVFKRPRLDLIENGGWHFNHLLRGDSLNRKVIFSSHTELVDRARNLSIESALASAHDIYRRQDTKVVKIDNSFPRYVQENLHKLEDYIYPTKG